MLGYDEGNKLGLFDGEVSGTTLVNVDGITIGIDVGTDLGPLDGSFGGSNDDKFEGLFLGGSLGFADGKVLGYDEGVWLSFSFTNPLTPLVGFCWYGHVQCLFFC